MFVRNGAEHWVNLEKESDCYVCNKSNLVYILFQRSTALKDFELVTNRKIRDVLWKYYNLDAYVHSAQVLPVVLGSATNWNPVKMMPQLFFALLKLCKTVSKS